MLGRDRRVKADNFEVVMVEGDEVPSPLHIINSYHTVALCLQLSLSNISVASSEHLANLKLLLLGAERIVLNIFVISDNLIERLHVFMRELGRIVRAHAKHFKCFVKGCQIAVLLRELSRVVDQTQTKMGSANGC